MSKKKNTLIIFLMFSILFLFGCTSGNKSTTDKTNKLKVIVSFNAMKEFTYAIGKDKINIETLVPNGTEPHDFESNIKNMKSIKDADIFIYSGFGMESWKDKVINSAGNKNLVLVDASKDITPIKNTDSEEIKEHGTYDPHVWISLKSAKIQSKNIRDALSKADPKNKNFYYSNYEAFAKKLDALDTEYKNKFSHVKNKNFVTGHAAFAYLCRDYNLKQNSVEGVFAEGEPSPKKLEELIKYSRQNNIKTIFVENMVSPKVSNTLAKEINAKVEKIYTLESSEDNKDYIESMTYNLKTIYDSLK